MKMKRTILMMAGCMFGLLLFGQKTAPKVSKKTTQVTVSIPSRPASVDPMIYGQMLEDCNDRVIYGGVVGEDGSERPHVTALLKELNMPVVRWPGGTYVHEYDWEKGTGPRHERPTVSTFAWGGIENHQFGTDEFLAWCRQVGTVPYINLNMGNKIYGGSLGDALNWLEYVNGPAVTVFGQKRAQNGHPEPYGVPFWCIGNENYGPWGRQNAETARVYSGRLHKWAGTIKNLYPDVHLLGVGHTYNWNDTVLRQNGELIDFLTLHFYMGAGVKDGLLENETSTTFAPAKLEMQLAKNVKLLEAVNARLGRADHPIRFSIDEWNCRHSVFDGEKHVFTRNDDRRQYDVATVAGMLNVFIRQSPAMGMANYIFPVNGHGLIRTVGETDAYRTPPFYIFELYRKYMTGSRWEVAIEGLEITLPVQKLAISGDFDPELNAGEVTLSPVDGTAIHSTDGNVYLALINRSPDESQRIKVTLPKGWSPDKIWKLESGNINDANTIDRSQISPQTVELKKRSETLSVTISPCGFNLIRCCPVVSGSVKPAKETVTEIKPYLCDR
jgi:alpha-N-arabinofuranosidase